jgi:hypothetical protein
MLIILKRLSPPPGPVLESLFMITQDSTVMMMSFIYLFIYLFILCVCVFITAGPCTKLFGWGGGGYGRTCATRDDEPRPVWTSLPITH